MLVALLGRWRFDVAFGRGSLGGRHRRRMARSEDPAAALDSSGPDGADCKLDDGQQNTGRDAR